MSTLSDAVASTVFEVFPFPLPARCREIGKRKGLALSKHIAVDGLGEDADSRQGREPLVEGSVADPALGTELGDRERLPRIGHRVRDPIVDCAFWLDLGLTVIADLESEGIAPTCQVKSERGYRWRGTVLYRHRELIPAPTQVQVGVSPAVQV